MTIDWLAQEPVTRVLTACGERVHPASARLAGESPHIAAVARGQELNVFEAWRQMDEILVANFMVFHDLTREHPYDLWVADEAWEVDHFQHENPELKRAAYCFITDFVGWLPMPEGGEREAELTADHNAEMIEHVERFPRLRDRSLFIGQPEDVVPATFGPGLPEIGPWVAEHFDFCGYVLAPDAAPEDRSVLRREFGFGADERVCVVSVGGSGVGGELLAGVVEALPAARALMPGLRMVAVCGPRIDPQTLPTAEGLEVLPYVHRLSRMLAASDVAVVQGGLATTMELAAARRPFLYFPLSRHCEQSLHVRHRLERYGAGRAMDFATATPQSIARALDEELQAPRVPLAVQRDGAARAARLIAELV
jgi:hypothetical protein